MSRDDHRALTAGSGRLHHQGALRAERGPSPVDRAKQGLKRSLVSDAHGIPLGVVPAGANIRDDRLLGATLDTLTALGPLSAGATVHLDAGYDYDGCRQDLAVRGLAGQIATPGGGSADSG
jgi:IS5 family transposase